MKHSSVIFFLMILIPVSVLSSQGKVASNTNKSNEIRSNGIEWFGDPIEIIRKNFPDKRIGEICVVSSDCPATFQCVFAGFEGRCVQFE